MRECYEAVRKMARPRCGVQTSLVELSSSTEMFFAAIAHVVIWTCLAMIQPVLLAHEVQFTLLTDPMFLGVCPMTLRSFNGNEMSVAAPAPYVVDRVDIVVL